MRTTTCWGGVALIADGVAGLIWPSRYLRLLEVGPNVVRDTFEALANRPDLTRALCIGEIVLGSWMVAKNI